MKNTNLHFEKQENILLDKLSSNYGFFYTVSKRLQEMQTPFQKLELIETDAFGKVLLLDGATQVVEFGEEYYHEPLAHFPLLRLSDEKLKKVLILGGGDGGVMREVLRFAELESVELVELDRAVVDYCQKHFPKINDGAFANNKSRIFFQDANDFVDAALTKKNQTYDAIIMDMTDPCGPSRTLYTQNFLSKVKKLLAAHGVFAMHAESAFFCPMLFRSIVQTLQSVFPSVVVHNTYIPMYGAVWSIAVAENFCPKLLQKIQAEKEIKARIVSRNLQNLKVVNTDTFFATMAHSPTMQELLASKGKLIINEQDIDALKQ